ncbi:MAG: hypothetical protein MUP13_08990 [Thermoanaerobaculales bacterium]|nr:hypothetical protein [Thermoanaerobaculales bacterium]
MLKKSAGSLWVLFVVVSLLAAPCVNAASESAEIIVSAQAFDEYLPDVAYNSVRDEYFVVWHDKSPLQSRSIMARRYTAAGAFIAEYIIAFEDGPPRDNAQPSVAYDPVNDRYLVVWVRDYFGDGSDWDVYGRFVPWNGPIVGLAAFSINSFTSKQWNPRIAFGGTAQEFMVTWWNEGSGGVKSYVSAQRVAAAGNTVGGAITVTYDALEERVAPDIAYNHARNEYIIAYQRMDAGGGNIYGVRLASGGAILGGDFGIAAWPDAETSPRISASRVSDRWAVVWNSQVTASEKDVFARLVWVNGTGAIETAAPVNIDHSDLNEIRPDVSAFPESSNFLVAYQAQYSNLSGKYGIHAQVLNADNTLGRFFLPRGLYIGEILTDCSAPAVAGGKGDWMVAWEHDRDATPTYQDIHGRVLFDEIFSDGFESGNTTRWSSTVP